VDPDEPQYSRLRSRYQRRGILTTLTEQALKYEAQVHRAHVSALTQNNSIFTLYSRCVLLATGVRDHLLDIEGAAEAVKRSPLRVCPICDAFDKRIAVIGDRTMGKREAEFLRNYSDQVTLLDITSSARAPTPEPMSSHGIERISIRLSELKIKNDRVTLSSVHGERDFDVVYLALGGSPQRDLACSLLAACDEHGALLVNAHQETSVPRLYAAGDLVRGLNQVVVAGAESAIAATDIHNKLAAQKIGVSRR
jgi:thioredoxin reductase (NADPH)